MNIFFYNRGWEHRGVWHLAEGEVKIEQFPEKRRNFTDEIIEWKVFVKKEDFVPGVEYYEYDHYMEVVSPVNPRWIDRKKFAGGSRILGRSKAVLVTPAYQKYTGTAACGSGTFTADNSHEISYSQKTSAKKAIGKDFGELAVARTGALHVQYDGEPPEPFCRNCLKVMERRSEGWLHPYDEGYPFEEVANAVD